MSSSARSEAAHYHRRGWCPIPVKERSKATSLAQLAPYLKRKATKEELNGWTWPGVGIVTGPLSGVLVLDVDGPRGEEKLKEFGHPPTPMVRTPSGGLHLYFSHPGGALRTGIRVAPELDVKAAGGYVVAPPSVGPNGRRYEWIVSPEEADLADPPEWLMRLLERPRRNGVAPPVGKKIPPGERNRELASIAGTMRRRGMEQPEILAALQAANERRCDPSLEVEEVEKIAASVARYEPVRASEPAGTAESAGDVVHVSFNGHGSKAQLPPRGYNLTDLGNSERFVADHGEGVRYCFPWRKWLVWTGTRWDRDDTSRVQLLAKETVRRIYREAAAAEDEGRRKELAKHATRSEAETKIRAMLALSKAEVPVSPEELDADPWSLNAENGTIDLRTGELREHRREDLITKLAPVHYDPAAEAPRFAQFLREVLVEEILIGFVRRFAGYTLTGSTEERVFAILHGLGKNGKTTLVELLREAMGEYAANTSTETILTRRNEGVSNDVAALKGARLVSAAEVEQDRRLAESKVKNLTGTDMVTARFLYSEPFDFRPEFKLWLSTNNKPIIRGTDDAIWDRIRLIPFEQRFAGEQRDPKLPEKLREELPGVLAWMVTGCMEWQREGLGEPEKVEKATRGYRAEMDVLASFIEDCCVVDPAAWVKFKDLYAIYQQWCDESGEHPESKQRLGNRLKDRGFEPDRGTGNVPIRRGIGIRDDRGTDPESYPASSDRGADENLPKARLGNSAQDAAPGVTPQNTRKTAESGENSYPSYPQIHKPPLKNAREGELQKQGNSGNSGNSEAASEDRSRAPKVEKAAGVHLGEWLSEHPDWFRRQADKHLQDPAEATLAALCAAVADAALGDSRRAGEARPRVEAFLRRTEDELLGRGDEDLEGLGDLFGDDDGGTR